MTRDHPRRYDICRADLNPTVDAEIAANPIRTIGKLCLRDRMDGL